MGGGYVILAALHAFLSIYYINYDIGIHEIWQPVMKLYKCIYPSTSSPLENVQIKNT